MWNVHLISQTEMKNIEDKMLRFLSIFVVDIPTE